MSDSASARSEKQLDRVLSFFPRVEAKASFLFAIDTGMLGFAVLNVHKEDVAHWYVAGLALVFVGMTATSLFYVYRCVFPHLKGGDGSLIYFRSIAGRSLAGFGESFASRDETEHLKDLSEQIWRNSTILRVKFDYLKRAFQFTMCAIAPWLVMLTIAVQLRPMPTGM